MKCCDKMPCSALCLITIIIAARFHFLHLYACLTCSSILYMPHLFTYCFPTIICVMLMFFFFVFFLIFVICYISLWFICFASFFLGLCQTSILACFSNLLACFFILHYAKWSLFLSLIIFAYLSFTTVQGQKIGVNSCECIKFLNIANIHITIRCLGKRIDIYL